MTSRDGAFLPSAAHSGDFGRQTGGRDPAGRGLAEPYRIHGFEGSLAEYLEHLEWFYRAIVGEAGICLWGRPVRAGGQKASDGRDARFWHIITNAAPARTEPRRLSIARSSSLPLAWDLLERLAAGDPRAVWWQEWGTTRRCRTLHVADVDFSLHVVLAVREGAFVLKTMYPLVKRNPCAQRGLRGRLMARAARSWERGDSRRDSFSHADWRRPQVDPLVWPDPRHEGPVRRRK